MKNAPAANCNESAQDKRNYTCGTLPKRCDTIRAHVLASLLNGKEMTGMEAVFEESTTRLSAVIHALAKEYGWHFDRRDLVVNTKDGRTAQIVAYSLSQSTIEQALAMGARAWIDEVKATRAQLKQSAAKRKKVDAASAADMRRQLRKQDPRQQSLWGDA